MQLENPSAGRCAERANGFALGFSASGTSKEVRWLYPRHRIGEMAHAAQFNDRFARALSRPSGRPLALKGRSGSGKTTLLRRATGGIAKEAVWLSAFDLVQGLSEAIREDRLSSYCEAFLQDERPLCVEHLEDLRGKPRTRAELERLLRSASRRRPVVLTLTLSSGDKEVARWLRTWTTLLSMPRSR
jgi:hypothetical protein